jgi:hypothetical protein
MIGKGSPFKNKVKGNVDELYLDSTCAVVWIKEADAGKVTGWKCLGIVVPTGEESNRTSAPTHPRLAGIPH